MKRWLCLALCAVLCLSLCAPALAMELDDGLESVASAVIAVLGIEDDYTEFSGDWDDWLGGRWNLWWSKDDRSLSVSADETGKILDVWRYEGSSDSVYYAGFDARFPAQSETEALSLCEDWLAKLIPEPEMAVVEDSRIYLSGSEWFYSGTVYMNNIPSPVTFSLRLDGNGTLISYSRSDAYGGYVGELPAAESAVTQADAAAKLASAVEFELYWVSDGEGEAALRYVPSYPRTVVDGVSGEIVDMDALYAGFYDTGMGASVSSDVMEAAAEAEDRNAGRSLTETELASVDAYREAMTADELDAALRGIAELGLDESFVCFQTDYAQDDESGDITATLRYTKEMTPDQLYGYSEAAYYEQLEWSSVEIEKYFTLNAKTGELQSLWTYYPLWEEGEAVTEAADTAAVGESFLKQIAPDKLAVSALCTVAGAGETTWTQVEQGYFFPENRMELEINAASGTVDRYSVQWDDAVTFGDTEIIGEDKAALAYTDAMTVRLGYVAWPVAVGEEPVFRPYADAGYTWVEELRLAWYCGERETVEGVDAVTGEVIQDMSDSAESYEYGDLDGVAQKEAIERLGRAGIGVEGGSFEPGAALTMETAAQLLLQAQGFDVSYYDDEQLGAAAREQRFVDTGAWEPERELTRMEFIKMLLRPSVYGEACKLADIWTVSYRDKRSLDASDLGYAAVAQALGLVTEKKLNGGAIATRAEAAAILCAFLSR